MKSLRLILVISSALLACIWTFSERALGQERWIPDYENRDKWQQPEKIMDSLGVKAGMVIADVGAGKGYFTFKLAKRIGSEGTIFATDIDEEALKTIRNQARKEGFKNIVTILGQKHDPGLPDEAIDLVLMVHVFHIVIHDQEPIRLLDTILPCLKPDGLVVLVQWDGEKMGYSDVYAYSRESVLKVIEESCFELVRIETFLPRETIFILKAKAE